MDKNTLVGAILIGAVVIGFSIYSRPSQEEMERAQHYQDSIETVVQQQEEQMLKAKQAEAAQVLQADSTSQFFAPNSSLPSKTTSCKSRFPTREDE